MVPIPQTSRISKSSPNLLNGSRRPMASGVGPDTAEALIRTVDLGDRLPYHIFEIPCMEQVLPTASFSRASIDGT